VKPSLPVIVACCKADVEDAIPLDQLKEVGAGLGWVSGWIGDGSVVAWQGIEVWVQGQWFGGRRNGSMRNGGLCALFP
jgi:hypothetical protein